MSAGIAAVAFALKTFREHATPTRTTGSELRNISITVDRSFADGSCCGPSPPDTLLESATQPSVAIAHRCHAPDLMAPPSERTRSRIGVRIRVRIRIAAAAVNLCKRLRGRPSDFDVAVLQCCGQRINCLGASSAAERPDDLLANVLIRVAQRRDERVGGLFRANPAQGPRRLAADV